MGFMPRLLCKTVLGGLFFAGLGLASTVVPLAIRAADQPPLIPREVLFGNPEIIDVSLSPDGQRIAYLAPDQGVLNLWVRDLQGEAPPRVLTHQRSRPQRGAWWTSDGRYLITTRDNKGDENTVLVRIDPQTGDSLDLTPVDGVKAGWVAADRDVPNEIVVGLNDRDPRFHDLYVIEVDSGKRRLLYRNTDDGRMVNVEWVDGAWQPVLRSQVWPMEAVPMSFACPETRTGDLSSPLGLKTRLAGRGWADSPVMVNGCMAHSAPARISHVLCAGVVNSFRHAARLVSLNWCTNRRQVRWGCH